MALASALEALIVAAIALLCWLIFSALGVVVVEDGGAVVVVGVWFPLAYVRGGVHACAAPGGGAK